jgi:hypothetical protein
LDAGYGPTSYLGGDALTWLYSIGQVSCTILGLLLFKPPGLSKPVHHIGFVIGSQVMLKIPIMEITA